MPGGLDDLRNVALEPEEEEQVGFESAIASGSVDDRIFGMTAVERMFVSIGCFLLTSLLGCLLLLVMEKIAI